VIRQLLILQLLEASRRGLTIAELYHAVTESGADGCSERTLYRDVQLLQQVGFQLVETESRWTVYRQASNLQAWPLRPSEVLTLLLSEDLLPPSSAGVVGIALRDLRQRLMTRLTPEGRAMVKELRASNLATQMAPLHQTDHDRVFEAIDDAAGREHCLRLRYRTPGEATSERVVEPHLFWVHSGRPYLVAYCRAAQEFRTFAIQRVQSAEVLDEPFERRPGFDSLTFIQRGFGVLQGEPCEVHIEFGPEVAHLAHERLWHPSQQVAPGKQGAVVLNMTVAGLAEVAAWVASFGGRLRALGPESLIRAVRELHQGGLAAHAQGPRKAAQSQLDHSTRRAD
jgi:predicted DNA-binding transcriptional regulator YafY